jgi:hypothetical protein
MSYHLVQYDGPFGFIKPWTAVQDGRTFSQQFLTPSIIEGMRRLLGVTDILRHRLSYRGIDDQMERIQAAGWYDKGIRGRKGWRETGRKQSILYRGILLEPRVTLAFSSANDAEIASAHHLCLCRNEDLLYPTESRTATEAEFDRLPGFELLFGQEHSDHFLVGYNRYEDATPMYGSLRIHGDASTRGL